MNRTTLIRAMVLMRRTLDVSTASLRRRERTDMRDDQQDDHRKRERDSGSNVSAHRQSDSIVAPPLIAVKGYRAE